MLVFAVATDEERILIPFCIHQQSIVGGVTQEYLSVKDSIMKQKNILHVKNRRRNKWNTNSEFILIVFKSRHEKRRGHADTVRGNFYGLQNF